VCDHGELTRIEVGKNERKIFFDEKQIDKIARRLHSLRFIYVTFDLDGYRSGDF
jgi:uncharacterized protein